MNNKSGECICLNCSKTFSKGKNTFGKYCNNKCQNKFQYQIKITKWKAGELSGYVGETRQLSVWLRRYLLIKYNNTCCKCGWNKRHPIDNLPLVEVNHIDGNAENCKEENLEVVCPNCHSETPNFRARNKDSKRNRRPI